MSIPAPNNQAHLRDTSFIPKEEPIPAAPTSPETSIFIFQNDTLILGLHALANAPTEFVYFLRLSFYLYLNLYFLLDARILDPKVSFSFTIASKL